LYAGGLSCKYIPIDIDLIGGADRIAAALHLHNHDVPRIFVGELELERVACTVGNTEVMDRGKDRRALSGANVEIHSMFIPGTGPTLRTV
jgi:hypothetical protein